jgi:hypothetical protein
LADKSTENINVAPSKVLKVGNKEVGIDILIVYMYSVISYNTIGKIAIDKVSYAKVNAWGLFSSIFIVSE